MCFCFQQMFFGTAAATSTEWSITSDWDERARLSSISKLAVLLMVAGVRIVFSQRIRAWAQSDHSFCLSISLCDTIHPCGSKFKWQLLIILHSATYYLPVGSWIICRLYKSSNVFFCLLCFMMFIIIIGLLHLLRATSTTRHSLFCSLAVWLLVHLHF